MQKVFPILVLSFLLFGSAELSSQQVGEKIVVAVEKPRLKSGSEFNNCSMGDIFEVRAVEKEWLKIKHRDRFGWLSKSDVIRIENAQRLFDELVKESTDKGSAYRSRAFYFLEIRNPHKAIEDFSIVLKESNKDIEVYLARGIAWLKVGEAHKAMDDFGEVIKLDPKNHLGYMNRASASLALGLPKQAISDAEKAISINSKFAGAYHARGLAYQSLGKLELAMKDLNMAVELDPTRSSHFNTRGTLWMEIEKYDEAVQDLNKARELDPNVVDILLNRGDVFYITGKFSLAERDYTEAAKLQPKNPLPFLSRGLVNKELGKTEMAISDFSQAIKQGWRDAAIYHHRAEEWMRLGDTETKKNIKNLAKAISDLNRSLELDRSYAPAHFARFSVNLRLGNFEKSFADLRQAKLLGIELTSEQIGQAFLAMGNLDCETHYTEAVEVGRFLLEKLKHDSMKCFVYYRIAVNLHEHLDDPKKALEDYNQAVRLLPQKKMG